MLDDMFFYKNFCKRVSWYILMVYMRKRFKFNIELCYCVWFIFFIKEYWEFLDKDCL